MTQFKPRPYAEIMAARRDRIANGEKTNVHKGACFFCDYPFQAKEIFCSSDCREGYEAERVELTAPQAD